MSATTDGLGGVGESGRAMLALEPRETLAPARRLVTAEQLMAPQYGVVLPRLDGVPVEQRFLADDREVIRLAEILVDSKIGFAADWDESQKEPNKYIMLTLERWISDHGAFAIDRRFDLEVALTDRLVDYADERTQEGTLYLIVDPGGAAFVLLNPVIELLGQVHRRLPATFFSVIVEWEKAASSCLSRLCCCTRKATEPLRPCTKLSASRTGRGTCARARL